MRRLITFLCALAGAATAKYDLQGASGARYYLANLLTLGDLRIEAVLVLPCDPAHPAQLNVARTATLLRPAGTIHEQPITRQQAQQLLDEVMP